MEDGTSGMRAGDSRLSSHSKQVPLLFSRDGNKCGTNRGPSFVSLSLRGRVFYGKTNWRRRRGGFAHLESESFTTNVHFMRKWGRSDGKSALFVKTNRPLWQTDGTFDALLRTSILVYYRN
jgi:hypothetical protein